MSTSIQEVFDRIQKTKKEQKELKTMYRDALNNSGAYQRSQEELKKLKEEKKKYEDSVKQEFASEFDKLEVLKNELMNDGQLLSDMVMTQVSKGQKVEIKDEYDTQYEPLFSVRFKKIG
jgi:predicted nuclease with TOPRIM domain